MSELVRGLLRFSHCEMLLSGSGGLGRGLFRNPEEVERPPLEAATRQRLVKTRQTEKTYVCVLVNCKGCELVKQL
jgi:hypothetical protein